MAPQEAGAPSAPARELLPHTGRPSMIPASPERSTRSTALAGAGTSSLKKLVRPAQSAASLSRAEAKDSVVRRHEESSPVAEGNFYQRGGVRVDLEQVGHHSEHAAKRAAVLVTRPPQHFLGPRGKSLQAAAQFLQDRRSLPRAGKTARQLGKPLSSRGSLLPTSGERRLSRGQLVRRLF